MRRDVTEQTETQFTELCTIMHATDELAMMLNIINGYSWSYPDLKKNSDSTGIGEFTDRLINDIKNASNNAGECGDNDLT